MKKLILLLPLFMTSLFAQESDFKMREITVMASLGHEKEKVCKQSGGRRSPVQEVEISEMEERALGLYAGVTSMGDVATIRKDKKDGKTYATFTFCLPEASKVKGVIIPGIHTSSSANCGVDQITSMDIVLTLTDKHGVDTDIMKAFRPIDFDETSLCEKKRGLEINDSDPTIPLPAKDKESEYGVDELKVEQN